MLQDCYFILFKVLIKCFKLYAKFCSLKGKYNINVLDTNNCCSVVEKVVGLNENASHFTLLRVSIKYCSGYWANMKEDRFNLKVDKNKLMCVVSSIDHLIVNIRGTD